MSLAAGTRLGPYEVIGLIGAGGMGEVYKARDTRLDRTVAIKVPPAELSADPERRARFEREARTISALNHPHICTLYDVGDWGGTPYLVMEHLAGETLAERLQHGPLPLAQALEVGAQVADALDAAHKQGIVHRDLKPGNVMLTRSGAKLLDFGLARLKGHGERPAVAMEASAATETEALTGRGTILGTLPYMAPEQLEGRQMDSRADLWALGTILYEVVTGQRAFTGSSPASLIGQIMNADPPALATLQPLSPPTLERVVRRCLAKHPDDRWDTAHDVAEELRWISHTATVPQSAMPARRPWRRRAFAVASALIVLGGLAGVTWLWMFRPTPGSVADPSVAATLPPADHGKIMLAVLPVENLSGDPAQEYFSDGLTDELIAQLGQLQPRRLGVIARTSAMRYKRSQKPIDEIGRELGVSHILEGSLRREGERARITAQLIQVRDQTQLWSRSYDREVALILSVQNEVARQVAESLALELLSHEQSPLGGARPVNPEAHDLYLKGRHHWFLRTAPELLKAAEYFQAATKADPTFALAYAGLGDTYGLYSWYGVQSARESFPQARAAAERALELDGSLVEARTTLAFIALYYDWDWTAAAAQLKEVLERRPEYVIARQWYSEYLVAMGRTDAAIAEIRRAQESDPLSPLLRVTEGYACYFGGRHDEAISALQRALDLDPSFQLAHSYLARTYLEKGAYREALEEARHTGDLLRGGYQPDLACILARSGRRQEATRMLGEMLDVRGGPQGPRPTDIAMIYSALGEREQAETWLETAYEERDVQMVRLRVDPRFALLRSDSRFKALVARMRFPEP